MRSYEIWQDPRDGSFTVATVEGIADHRQKGLLTAEARCLQHFEAASWEEAMAIYHLRMGFEPYQPNGDAEPCPNNCGAHYYPKGSGECPNCGDIA